MCMSQNLTENCHKAVKKISRFEKSFRSLPKACKQHSLPILTSSHFFVVSTLENQHLDVKNSEMDCLALLFYSLQVCGRKACVVWPGFNHAGTAFRCCCVTECVLPLKILGRQGNNT